MQKLNWKQGALVILVMSVLSWLLAFSAIAKTKAEESAGWPGRGTITLRQPAPSDPVGSSAGRGQRPTLVAPPTPLQGQPRPSYCSTPGIGNSECRQ